MNDEKYNYDASIEFVHLHNFPMTLFYHLFLLTIQMLVMYESVWTISSQAFTYLGVFGVVREKLELSVVAVRSLSEMIVAAHRLQVRVV